MLIANVAAACAQIQQVSKMLETQSSSAINQRITLSDEEKLRIANRSRRGLLVIFVWQVSAAVVTSLLFLVFSGMAGALSVLAGAGCYLAPNALFVGRLVLATFKPSGAKAGVFLLGNALKVLVSGALLWALAVYGGEAVNWIAAIFGLIAALKGYWVGLLVTGGRLGRTL